MWTKEKPDKWGTYYWILLDEPNDMLDGTTEVAYIGTDNGFTFYVYRMGEGRPYQKLDDFQGWFWDEPLETPPYEKVFADK